jgi:putative ABC transport system permease protein
VLPLRYSVRSVWERRSRSALTVAVIALVVVAVSLLSGLVTSLRESLAGAGSPANLIVLRKGAASDGASALPLEVFQTVRFFEGIARGANGEPLVSPEIVVFAAAQTRGGPSMGVQVRGVESAAFELRPELRVVEGRALRPSSGEALIGRAAGARYRDTETGAKLALGNSTWTVVGRFEANGSALESEIWVDAHELANDAKRSAPYSSLRVRIAEGADAGALVRRIESDPRFVLQASRESEYYAKQAARADALYVVVGALALLAGVGAAFGATNTLYAAVQARTREIGTLRALGFSRAAIMLAFMIESAFLALVAGIVGCILALPVNAMSGATSGENFSEIAFAFRISPVWLVIALVAAVLMGIVGGLFPSFRAARTPITAALRDA